MKYQTPFIKTECPQSGHQSLFWGLRPQTPASKEILIFKGNRLGFASAIPFENTDAILHSRNRILRNICAKSKQRLSNICTTFEQCTNIVDILFKRCSNIAQTLSNIIDILHKHCSNVAQISLIYCSNIAQTFQRQLTWQE